MEFMDFLEWTDTISGIGLGLGAIILFVLSWTDPDIHLVILGFVILTYARMIMEKRR